MVNNRRMQSYAHPMTSDPITFFDDTPRTDPESQDELGYRKFARSVAEAIANIEAPKGYVVGIHGPWGSGKSTILNFIDFYLEEMKRQGTEDILRIDFRPWIVSGHDDLVGAFFKLLRQKMEEREARDHGISGWAKVRFTKLLRWVKFRFQKGDADAVIDTIAKIGLIVDGTGGMATAAGTVAAKRSFGAAVNKWLEEPALQAVYDKLVSQLSNRPGKILVSIDDIDRLTTNEIRTIMQMVKSVGRLPNVIYMLSYDRSVVWNALDGIASRALGSSSFAEKIVQLEIELPVPEKNKLLRILDRELKPILGGASNSYRWTQLLVDGLHRWIRLPRDVIRLANSTKFVWPGLNGEVDAQDLVIMEGMRLFDPELFDWVKSNRDYVLGQGRWRMTMGDEANQYGELFKTTLGENRSDRIELLCALFPRLANHLKTKAFINHDEHYDRMLVARRIAVEPAYDAYFSLFPLEDVVSKADLRDFISHLDDESYLVRMLRSFSERRGNEGQSLVGDLLEQVRYSLQNGGKTTTSTEPGLRALFEVGDDILAIEDSRMLVLGAGAQLSFAVKDIVAELGDYRATEVLQDVFSSTQSVAFAADFWVDRGRELGVFSDEGSSTRDGPLSRESFDALRASLKALIERKASNRSLEQAPRYFDILRAWVELDGDPSRARAWLSSNVMSNPNVLAKAAFGLLSYSTGDDGKRRYGFSRSARDLNDPSRAFYETDVLLEAATKWAGNPQLNDDEAARVEALRSGLVRFNAGQSAQDW